MSKSVKSWSCAVAAFLALSLSLPASAGEPRRAESPYATAWTLLDSLSSWWAAVERWVGAAEKSGPAYDPYGRPVTPGEPACEDNSTCTTGGPAYDPFG